MFLGVCKHKGITPNLAGSDGKAQSTTKSAIAEGTIQITQNKDQDITDLSRDTENANNPLTPIFDKNKVLENQEAAKIFGEIGFTIVGDIGKDWKADDPRRIALHALIGGLMAEINGGTFGDGMSVGAINELLISKIVKHMEDSLAKGEVPAISPEQVQWISAILGSAINDLQGASISVSGTKNNAFGDHYWKFLNYVLTLQTKIKTVIANAEITQIETPQEKRRYDFGNGDIVFINIGHAYRDTHNSQRQGAPNFTDTPKENFVQAVLSTILINDASGNLPATGQVSTLTTNMFVYNASKGRNEYILLGIDVKRLDNRNLHVSTFYPIIKN